MTKMFLSTAVLILSHFLNSVDCVSGAEKEAMYSEILARAHQRKATSAAPVAGTGNKCNRRKYSAQQAQLIQDVTLIFGSAITVSEKFEYFKRLMTELGIAEDPVSINRFHDFTSLINRHMTGENPYVGERSKIGPEASEKLHKMLSENPKLTYIDAFQELRKMRVGPLPPPTYVQNWIQNRRKESGFLKMLVEPFVYPSAVAIDGLPCSVSAFADDQEGEKVQDIVCGSKRKGSADAIILPARKWGRLVDEEVYNNLLVKARSRVQPGSSKDQYTIEHSELIADVVTTCEFLTVGEQYEVFRLLSEDLEILEMSRKLFYARARSARKRTGCSAKSRALLNPETAKVMKSIFETNPEISAAEAHEALQARGFDVPSLDDVRNWLKNHKSYLKRASKNPVLLNHLGEESNRGQQSSSVDESFDDDAAMWSFVSSLFAGDHDSP
jgi:hypothetical protein